MDFEEKYDFTPATDGEMQGFEYAIPDGFTAEIKDGKVVVKKQYSEDERMVNRIISYLKQDIEEYPEREERINEMLAYLEKQKEQRPVMWSAYDKATIEYIIEDIKELRDEETNEEVIDTYDRELNLLQCINDSVKLCNYTNPAEWSEEDEKMLEKILCIIDPGVILTEDNREYCDELKSWLKSFPERFNLQPKQEWSKEDEKKLAGITAIIEEWWDNQSQKEKDYYGDQGYLSWLKSFRPQLKQQWSEEDKSIKTELMDFISSAELSELLDEETQAKWYHWIEDKYGCSHWKPSEKQMDSLMRTITWLVEKGNHTDSSTLADLRRELQKLMWYEIH